MIPLVLTLRIGLGNEKCLHSLIRLVLTLRIGRRNVLMRKDWFTLIDSSCSDPKDWSGNEKRLHSLIPGSDPKDWLVMRSIYLSLIPLVLTLRIGRVMRNIYTH